MIKYYCTILLQGYSRPGDETREAGMLINTNYWKNALPRGVSLHSHLLMLWANLSSISISLLTQPGAEAKLAKIIPPEMFPVRDYCVHHLQAVWEDFCKVSRVSKEECTFLAMSSMKRLLEVRFSPYCLLLCNVVMVFICLLGK